MYSRMILVNFILPLLVIIVGGAIVLHYTDWIKPRGDFSIIQEQSSSMGFDESIITSETYVISNTFSNAIDEVSFDLGKLPEEAEVKAKLVSGIQRDLEVSPMEDGNYRIHIGSLRSNESIVLQVFLRTEGPVYTVPSIFSEEMVGTFSRGSGESNSSIPLIRLFFAVMPLLLTAVVIFITLKRGFIRVNKIRMTENNSAFVMVHSGMASRGAKVLSALVDSGSVGVYELSNMAFCMALEGDFDEAEKFIKASEFINGGSNHRNIHLNKSLISWMKGDHEKAKEDLDIFIKADRKIYERYKGNSVFLKQMADELGV